MIQLIKMFRSIPFPMSLKSRNHLNLLKCNKLELDWMLYFHNIIYAPPVGKEPLDPYANDGCHKEIMLNGVLQQVVKYGGGVGVVVNFRSYIMKSEMKKYLRFRSTGSSTTIHSPRQNSRPK